MYSFRIINNSGHIISTYIRMGVGLSIIYFLNEVSIDCFIYYINNINIINNYIKKYIINKYKIVYIWYRYYY